MISEDDTHADPRSANLVRGCFLKSTYKSDGGGGVVSEAVYSMERAPAGFLAEFHQNLPRDLPCTVYLKMTDQS